MKNEKGTHMNLELPFDEAGPAERKEDSVLINTEDIESMDSDLFNRDFKMSESEKGATPKDADRQC